MNKLVGWVLGLAYLIYCLKVILEEGNGTRLLVIGVLLVAVLICNKMDAVKIQIKTRGK